MRPSTFIVTISGLLIFGSAHLFAQNDCHTAIRQSVIQKNPRVEKVTFDQDSESRVPTGTHEEIKGNGRFLRHTGKWEDISWTCSYDTRSNRVITAEYSVFQGGPAKLEADTSKGWAKECQDQLRAKVKEDRPNAERVAFKSAKESKFFKTDALLEGDGFWERKDGVKKEFSYWCIYNTRSKKIVDSNYQPGE
jgi:hypothetical protein